MLEPPVGHLPDKRNVGVDPDAAEVQSGGHPCGSPDIAGPDRRSQRVLGAVGELDRLVLIFEALRGHDWSENLGLNQLIVLFEIGDQRRLEEESGRALALPTCEHSGVLGGPRD